MNHYERTPIESSWKSEERIPLVASMACLAEEGQRESENVCSDVLRSSARGFAAPMAAFMTDETGTVETQPGITNGSSGKTGIEAGTAGSERVAPDGLGQVQTAVQLEVGKFKREIREVLEVLLAQLHATYQGLQGPASDAAAAMSEEIRYDDAAEEHLKTQAAGDALIETDEKGENSTKELVDGAANEIHGPSDGAAPHLTQHLHDAVASAVEDARRQIAALAAEQTDNLKRQLDSRSEAHRLELNRIREQAAQSNFRDFKAHAEDLLREQGKSFEKRVKDLVADQLEWLESAFDAPGRGVVRFPTRLVAFLMLLAMTPALFCLYLNLRPVRRLQPDPPPDFFDSRPAWGAKRFQTGDAYDDSRWRLTDRMVARAYWEWAARHLESRYPFGTRLPENPPFEMQVEGIGFPDGLDSEFAKVHYWQKLQKAWNEPQSWEKVSGWDVIP